MTMIQTTEERGRFEVRRVYRDYLSDMTMVWQPGLCDETRERYAQQAMRQQYILDSLIYTLTEYMRGAHYVSAYHIGQRLEREAVAVAA